MSVLEATTPAELRAALLVDATLGPIAARAIADAAAAPGVAEAMAAYDALIAAGAAARAAGDLVTADAKDAAAAAQLAAVRELRRPVVADARAADAELAAALNIKSIATKRKVAGPDAQALLLANGDWGNLVFASRQAVSAEFPRELIVAAINAVTAIERPVMNTDDPAKLTTIAAALAALATAGIIAAPMAAALLELADATISPWEQVYGVGIVATPAAVSALMRGT